MVPPEFLLTVVLVTASGALAPGPLFVATLVQGTKAGARAGLVAAVGHTLVELPLILLLAFGLLTLATVPTVRTGVGLVGGLALVVFGGWQLRAAWRYGTSTPQPTRRLSPKSALVLGVVFTAVNPFFLLWWLTVGSKLILDALAFAYLGGVLVMFTAHIWMDYVFLATSAHLAHRGTNLLGVRRYRWVLVGLALVLLYFGANILWTTLS